ncbi:MAG: alpha/beta hydrolase-fold protein [Candidatus Altiarchaeota archaeon]
MEDVSMESGKVADGIRVFLDFVKDVENLPLGRRQDYVDSEFKNVEGLLDFPVIAGHEVLFVHRGSGSRVELVGDMSCWQTLPMPMTRVTGTDLSYVMGCYEEDARLDYKFLIDGSRFVMDTLNPKACVGGFGANSELRMPGYPQHPETEKSEGVPRGRVTRHVFECDAVVNGKVTRAKRDVSIYLPPGYEKEREHEVIYFNDGSDYLRLGRAADILDYMIDRGDIEPVVAVYVDPIDREADYMSDGRDIYLKFLTDELMPWVKGEHNVRTDADGTTLVGASAGGNLTAYAVYAHPEKFGNILCHSGALSCAYERGYGKPYGNEISDAFYPARVFMIVGTYDWDNISSNIWLYSDLKENKSVRALEFRRYHQGHSWGLWSDTLREALTWISGK